MRPERRQRVVAARAVRGQPYPAVSAELPVGVELAAALAALVDQAMQLLLELQDCGLFLTLLGR